MKETSLAVKIINHALRQVSRRLRESYRPDVSLRIRKRDRGKGRFQLQLRAHVQMEESAGGLPRGQGLQETDIPPDPQTGLPHLRETQA